MLEFEGPMGQCFSRFPTVSTSKRRGEKDCCCIVVLRPR